MLELDEKQLSKVCTDFFNITQFRHICLFDDSRRLLYAFSPEKTLFCTEVRKDPRLTAKCRECDHYGFQGCAAGKNPFIYKCHMGLTEVTAPLIRNGLTIGYLILGQVLEEGGRPLVEKAISELPENSAVDKDILLCALGEMESAASEKLDSAANILAFCIEHLWVSNIISFRQTSFRHHLLTYIDQNIASETLSVGEICRHFSVSRSFLYDFSIKEFGMGLSDYIRTRRIEKAKYLLLQGSEPIYAIAEECGFSTPSYFTKMFQKETGTLPKDFLKSRIKER
ncbi:MAG: PocR ligand-binding domain-containing protein [Clostridia bacterium]|nr:PocR ligand-binding domain-containing protein [Clostridia bacterium]